MISTYLMYVGGGLAASLKPELQGLVYFRPLVLPGMHPTNNHLSLMFVANLQLIQHVQAMVEWLHSCHFEPNT